MNSNSQAKELIEILDKKSSNSLPWFTDEELSVVLSQAQEEYIKSKYNPLGNKYGDGFENSEKRRKDLAQLNASAIISYDTTNSRYIISSQGGAILYIDDTNNFFSDSSIIKPNGNLWKLPKDLLWVTNEEITWNTTNVCYDGGRIEVKVITHDEYNQWIKNTFKKPYDELVWRLEYSREYNANTIVEVRENDNPLWYIVNIPAPIDDGVGDEYELTVNGDVYNVPSTGLTQETLRDAFTALFDTGDVTYRISGDGTIYVISDSEIITNSGTTTNDIGIYISYVPVPNQGDNDQNDIGTDYKVHELVTHGWEISDYFIRYIRRPRDIVVDFEIPSNQVHCELDESTHREITNLAVTKLMVSLQDPRTQLQMVEEQKSE